MKRLMQVVWLWLALQMGGAAAAVPVPGGVQSRAWTVIDMSSGHELAGRQSDLPLAPASLTQLMTAYVLLGDLKKNKLSLAETVTVPEAATQADGARLFLKAGDPASVDTLMQAMLVYSATDAVLTLVQAADGSEADFVARMNAEAKRLGMTRTRFMNATGLTEPGHVSSARDLALLSRALIRDFPDRLDWFAQKQVAYNGLTHYNANRLLWRDSTVDGLKVGRTTEAGYCMAASAKRGAQRRIAVVLGARSDAQRTQDALKLLNFAFENFDSALLYRAQKSVKTLEVYRGSRASVNLGFLQDFHLLAPRGGLPRLKAEVITRQPVVAPIRRGQRLGTLRLTLDGEVLGDYPLVALHEVSVAGIFGRGWDSIRLLFQ